jgi:hypothetical protein
MHKTYVGLRGMKEYDFNISGIDGGCFYYEVGSGCSENYYKMLGDNKEFGTGHGRNGNSGDGHNNDYDFEYYPSFVTLGDGHGEGEGIMSAYFYYCLPRQQEIKQEEYSFIEESNA